MKLNHRLLLLAALFVLALPLVFTGTASAKYMSDGAVPDAATNGWKLPSDLICIVGVHADGTIDVADGVTNRRDCIYLNKGTMNGGTPFDLSTITTQAACTDTDGTGSDGAKHSWATSGCWDASGNPISLKDLDRTSAMCSAKGGNWITTGKCVAFGADFKGQDAAGTPLAFGTKGTLASANAGFCYTTVRLNSYYTGTPACPSTSTNSSTSFGYSATNCTYAYGIQGYANANMTRVDGTTYAALGTYVDLTTLTTMGDCLSNGGSWRNWIPKSGTAAVATTPLASTIATFDLTRQAVDADEGCLHCHGYNAQYNGPAERWKDSYLKTGHKNMLRKVTANKTWGGADGVTYSAYAAGSISFGASPTATVSGVAKPLLYIFGDWMAPAPAGLDVIVDMSGSAKYNGTSNYSCAPCHTTGWSNPAAGTGLCNYSSATTQAACESILSGAFGAGKWYPMVGVEGIGTPGITQGEPADSFPAVTFTGAGTWNLDGIQCGRCHNATVPTVTASQISSSIYTTTDATAGGMGNVPAGPPGTWVTDLCFSCHQSIAKTTNGTGADADLAHPEALPVKNTATAPTYTPGFSGHVIGGSFLNSPHARATATIQPNSMGKYDIVSATYSSAFKGYTCWQSSTSNSPAKTTYANSTIGEIKDKTTCETLYGAGAWRPDTQGSCATCHDVHQSLFVTGQEGLRKECVSCHDNTDYATAVPVTAQAKVINHPTTAGTPAAVDPADPCVVCHMPKPTPADFPMHVWRINTDPTYSTFPTAAEFGIGATATKKNANTYPDGAYTNAVWVDIDLACGQCHNGAEPLAPIMSKASLAAIAVNMHTVPAISIGLSATYGATNLIANVSATATCSSAACLAPFSYSWNCGSGGVFAGTGATGTCTYTTAGDKLITVTVTDSATPTANTAEKAVAFKAIAPVVAPTAGGLTSPCPITGKTVQFTDASTASGATVDKVAVVWGDGTTSIGGQGTVFSHTYINTGSYTVTQRVFDSNGSTNNPPVQVVCTATTSGTSYGTVSGTLKYNNVAVAGATVQFTDTTSGKKYGATTNTAGAFSNSTVPVGTYNITAFKKIGTLTTTYTGFVPTTVTVVTGPNALGVLNATTKTP